MLDLSAYFLTLAPGGLLPGTNGTLVATNNAKPPFA
jgi:hypothetical protein